MWKRFYGWRCRACAAVAASAGTVYFAAVLFPAAKRASGSAGNKVQDLQFAYTPEQFVGVLDAWGLTNERAVGILKRANIIELDFVFPVLYSLALALMYASLSGRREPRQRDLVLFMLPFVAANFDWVENLLHLRLLTGIETAGDVKRAVAAGAFDRTSVFLAAAIASAKYALLVASAAGIAAVVLERVLSRRPETADRERDARV